MRVPIPEITDPALVSRRMFVEARQVAFIKSVVEASEGLACMFAERGGELLLVAPRSREAELERLVHDLRDDLCAIGSTCLTNGASGENSG